MKYLHETDFDHLQTDINFYTKVASQPSVPSTPDKLTPAAPTKNSEAFQPNQVDQLTSQARAELGIKSPDSHTQLQLQQLLQIRDEKIDSLEAELREAKSNAAELQELRTLKLQEATVKELAASDMSKAQELDRLQQQLTILRAQAQDNTQLQTRVREAENEIMQWKKKAETSIEENGETQETIKTLVAQLSVRINAFVV